ncbi:acyltransferase family protein [Streptomyces sp. NPDC050856]|uniref:acyltransferase family protein n=1 Tax=Streptomyces sp. NPDC050856 TaxID=3154939 RepID=UPI0033C172EB
MLQAPQGNPQAPITPTAQAAGRPAARAAGRDAYFDNAKYLAIVLVAVAHAWEPVMHGSRAARALYMFVYTFHMPAFIVISGYFSRGFTGRPDQLKRLVTGLAVPYVAFEAAYTLYKRWADAAHPTYPFSLTDPLYLTWFLVALFIWRLSTPLWRTLRYPLPAALVLAALASLTPGIGQDLDLQRVLQFLPFFVLGLALRPEHFALVRRPEVRRWAGPVLLAAAGVTYWVAPGIRMSWFYRSTSAEELGAPWWAGPVMTFALFGCGLVLTAAFLALVPGRRTWFTTLGAGTICGYLLHGFLVKAMDYWGLVAAYGWLTSPLGLIAVTALAAGAVTLLCTPPVRRALRCVTEPRLEWAFRRDGAPGEGRGLSRR